MINWLTWSSWSIASIALGLIALGAGITLVYGIVKSMLWCLTLTGRLLSRLWAWLTDTPVSSHGTAHFADAGEVQASGLLNDTGIPLAQLPDGRTLREPVNGHVALVAPPRSHKSWGVIMPVLREWRGSCVVNDLRGELHEHTHQIRESYGPCIRYAPTEKLSADLNPLDLIRWREDEMAGDLLRVATGLLSPEPGQAPTEYQQAAMPFLAALMLDRYAHGEGHLGAVLRFLSDPTRTPKAKMKSLEASPEPMVAHAAGLMAYMSEARLGANLAALANALNTFADPLVALHTSRSDIDLTELQHGNVPVSLYLCSPFSDQARLRPLWSCLLQMLMARFSAQGQTPRNRVLLCLDEAMNLGRLPELETGMSYLTGCQVQVFMAFQNRKQALHVYGEWSPILDAIPTTMFFTPVSTDRTTLEEISEALGTTTSVHATTSESRSVFGFLQRTMHGEQRFERPLMYPDEIARWSDETAVVLTKGAAPTMALKLDATPAAILALVQQSKPIVKRVAVAAAACLVLASVGAWALWPTPTTPAPRLAMTSEAGRIGAQALSMPADTTPPMPSIPTHEERLARLDPRPPKPMDPLPWRLTSQQRVGAQRLGLPGSDMVSGIRGGRYATQADCQAALAQQAAPRLTTLREQAATLQGIKITVVEQPNYVAWTQQRAGRFTQPSTTEAFCHLQEDAPT